jgi:hypothetical protein
VIKRDKFVKNQVCMEFTDPRYGNQVVYACVVLHPVNNSPEASPNLAMKGKSLVFPLVRSEVPCLSLMGRGVECDPPVLMNIEVHFKSAVDSEIFKTKYEFFRAKNPKALGLPKAVWEMSAKEQKTAISKSFGGSCSADRGRGVQIHPRLSFARRLGSCPLCFFGFDTANKMSLQRPRARNGVSGDFVPSKTRS